MDNLQDLLARRDVLRDLLKFFRKEDADAKEQADEFRKHGMEDSAKLCEKLGWEIRVKGLLAEYKEVEQKIFAHWPT